MTPVLEIKELKKVYGSLTAVNGISLSINAGEVFAFLGPNGAGKTTTVEMCEGIRKPTSGKIHLFGEDFSLNPSKIKERIGVLPQEFKSYERLTVKETLQYFASFFNKNRDIDEIISLMDLQDKKDELYINLSGGMKQRVGVAISLVNDPDLVFLDEPTTGLDPGARRGVWKAIKKLKKEGKTIFLTTHYMEEAEELADRIAIINKGSIITLGTTEELIAEHGTGYTVSFYGCDTEALKEILPETQLKTRDNAFIKLSSSDNVSSVISKIIDNKIKFDEIDVRRSNLEEVFLNLTGEKLEEGEKQ